MCGQVLASGYYPQYGLDVHIENCHNVFLNILLQFSIPAGGFYIMALVDIVAAAVKEKLSCKTLEFGRWPLLP